MATRQRRTHTLRNQLARGWMNTAGSTISTNLLSSSHTCKGRQAPTAGTQSCDESPSCYHAAAYRHINHALISGGPRLATDLLPFVRELAGDVAERHAVPTAAVDALALAEQVVEALVPRVQLPLEQRAVRLLRDEDE